jgi:cbb3-type cytochrome oxidase maturation protein
MEILYLLLPMSVVFALLVIGVIAWAIRSGQFDDLDREGERILEADDDVHEADAPLVDGNQARSQEASRQSRERSA